MDQKNKVINTSPSSRYLCYNEIIGTGGTKTVHRGYDTSTGTEVAWNIIPIKNMDHIAKISTLNEIIILRKISGISKYIMQFYDAWYNTNDEYIIHITELASYGSLHSYIYKVHIPIIPVAKRWGIQILKGLSALHDMNIVHRDIKTKNIYINSNTSSIIIGDFGCAKIMNNNCSTMVGTMLFMAPEIYRGEYNEKVDIYSFGLCYCEIITGEIPFREYIRSPVWISETNTKPPEILDKITDSASLAIIDQCISRDPNSRPTASKLLEDPYFVQWEYPSQEFNIHDIKKIVPIKYREKTLKHKKEPPPEIIYKSEKKKRLPGGRSKSHTDIRLNDRQTTRSMSDESFSNLKKRHISNDRQKNRSLSDDSFGKSKHKSCSKIKSKHGDRHKISTDDDEDDHLGI
jgi:WNK lysine deficient protein kinase